MTIITRWVSQKFATVDELKGCAAHLVRLYQMGQLDTNVDKIDILLLAPPSEKEAMLFMESALSRILRHSVFPVAWSYRVISAPDAVAAAAVDNDDDNEQEEENENCSGGSGGRVIRVRWKFRPSVYFSMSLRMEAEMCRIYRGRTVRLTDLMQCSLLQHALSGKNTDDNALRMLHLSLARLSDPRVGAVQLKFGGAVVVFCDAGGPEWDPIECSPAKYLRDAERAFNILSVSAVCSTPPDATTVNQMLPAPTEVFVDFAARARHCLQWYYFLRFCYRPRGGLLEFFAPPVATEIDRNDVQRALKRFFSVEMLQWTVRRAQRPETVHRWMKLHSGGGGSNLFDTVAPPDQQRQQLPPRPPSTPLLLDSSGGSSTRMQILFVPEKRLLVRALGNAKHEICLHEISTVGVTEATVATTRALIAHILAPRLGPGPVPVPASASASAAAIHAMSSAQATERLAAMFVEHSHSLNNVDRMQFTYFFFAFLAFFAALRGDTGAGYRAGGKCIS